MMFRNLTLFAFPSSFSAVFLALDDHLAGRQLKPVGVVERSSRGFVPPLGRDSTALSHRIDDCIWITLGGQDRILPAAVVNEALASKVAELERREARKIGGKERARLRGDLEHYLLPRALVRPSRVNAYIDIEKSLLVVDTSSRKTAEGVVSELRQALGSFPAMPVRPESRGSATLTHWIAHGPLPAGFKYGDECELSEPTESGANVKCRRMELGSEDVRRHLEAGMRCTRLGLCFDDHLDFVLGDDLVVRKLKFLEGATATLESVDHDSVEAEFFAQFALMTAELKGLFFLLDRNFRIVRG
ncbi:MAG: recombination-associated protein RdgC [Xanthomonadaceae bacterium]|nr:recombination-associated protein RdgC [Xanthomonadaceae bacterium]